MLPTQAKSFQLFLSVLQVFLHFLSHVEDWAITAGKYQLVRTLSKTVTWNTRQFDGTIPDSFDTESKLEKIAALVGSRCLIFPGICKLHPHDSESTKPSLRKNKRI